MFSKAVFGIKLHSLVYFEAIYFQVLILIKHIFIVDLFVPIDRIKNHWYWYLSPVFIEIFLWYVSKTDMRIFFPHRIEEGHGKGCFYWYKIYFNLSEQDCLCWLLNCVLHYFYHCPLILIVLLRCDRKLCVGRIQTRHRDFIHF